MRVLVTGASGFVGRAACAELVARGHEVAALVRRPGSEPPRTQAVGGDLSDGPGLARALDAARPEAVLHLAAETASQGDAATLRRVNVEGTTRLLEACRHSGAPRCIFGSTVVTGDARGRLLDEDTPLPVETEYGRSKQRCEELVRQSGLDWVILRPSHVYGAGGWYAEEFVSRLRKPGRFAVVGKGDNLWDVVHVEDVATALADAAERAPSGSLFHVVDDEPITHYDFMALTAEALGTGPPHRLPAFVARLIGGRDPVLAITRSARSSNARIKRELGWAPRYPNARIGVPDAVASLAA